MAIEYGFNDYICRGGIKISRVFNTDKVNPRDLDWKPVRFTDPVAPSNPFIGIPNKSKFNNPYSYKTTAYVELCLKHEDVFNLLLQISNGFDWRNLYCIWDTITHYCGGHKNTIKFLELNLIEISAFTGTVNSFGALGLEARHGVMGWGILKNTVTKEQAIDIINKVVSKYLKKKYCLNCQSKE